ncbi:MAG TPA: short-chain dehydrogenase/reductase, partial [Mucilaginibacter sp.]
PIAGKVLAGMPAFFEHASPASVVADVIYEAVTDGTTRLRYTAGEDARETIANRLQADDASFMGTIKTQFGL